MYHGVIFSFGSAKVCSPAIFETCFSYYKDTWTSFSLDKDMWIAATDYYIYFYIIVQLSIDSCSSFNNFYSFIIFSVLIKAVILLLNCLVLILYRYIHFLSLRSYFINLNIIWTFI